MSVFVYNCTCLAAKDSQNAKRSHVIFVSLVAFISVT